MKTDYEKLKAWKERSVRKYQEKKKKKPQRRISNEAPKRRSENATYGRLRKAFLEAHPTCILTGQPSTQIHHISKRYGKWLNLQRYWCAVSQEGHEIIEKHKKWAESRGLIIRINKTYEEHTYQPSMEFCIDWTIPIIYIDKDNLRAIMEDVKDKVYLNYKPY